MSKSTLITSPKVLCYINGVLVGRVTSFRWTSDEPHKAINGIDSATPVELAPTNMRCTGSLGLLRGILDGGAEALGLTTHSSQQMRARYFTLTLVERTSDTLLFRADYCTLNNQSWEVPERGYMRGTISFEALHWNNECKPAKG